MFIVSGRTELNLLSRFIVQLRMFYSSIQQWDPGAKPEGGLGVGVPQKLVHFLNVHSLKFKARWKWKAQFDVIDGAFIAVHTAH